MFVPMIFSCPWRPQVVDEGRAQKRILVGVDRKRPHHAYDVSIWGVPKIGVPPYHPFIDRFSPQKPETIQLLGYPPFMEPPIHTSKNVYENAVDPMP